MQYFVKVRYWVLPGWVTPSCNQRITLEEPNDSLLRAIQRNFQVAAPRKDLDLFETANEAAASGNISDLGASGIEVDQRRLKISQQMYSHDL